MSKIATIQMTSTSNLIENIVKAEALLINAVYTGTELIVLPERFLIQGKKSKVIVQFKIFYVFVMAIIVYNQKDIVNV